MTLRLNWLLAGCCAWLLSACAAPESIVPAAASAVTPAVTASALSQQASAEPPAPVFHFTTVGDSRHDSRAPGLTGQDRRWLQATQVLARMTREMAAVRPQALVFNGDMIMGYTRDATQVEREYAYWRGMVAGLMEQGTYVLPVPGNHEVQVPTRLANGRTEKLAQAWLEDAWRANMGDLILDETRWSRLTGQPAQAWKPSHAPAPGSDGVSTPQQQLSYSFDVGAVHLAVINTDPVGFDSSAPVRWLRADLAAAKARGARQFFVFGHKMAYVYEFQAGVAEREDGLNVRPALRDAFWDVIEAYGATYFCGHQHIYHASQPRLAQGGRAWQVIVGSGGSPFAAWPGQSSNPFDRFYAWADVKVYADDRVQIQVLGFDEHFGPTQVLKTWELR